MSSRTTQIAAAKAIHARTGRTFFTATRLLPDRVRVPTYALYAFFRLADEIVDDPEPSSVADQRDALDALRAEALGERPPTSEAMAAFAAVREEYGLRPAEIETFMDAMAMDLDRARYATTDELGDYLRGSAVAVANLLMEVYAADLDPAAYPHAAALAEAFQLTNFLRDVREDVTQYGRIYLPRETLERHGVSFETIESLAFDDRVADAIADELERTEALYREGVAGIHYLPEDVQFGVLLAAVLYAEHHRVIRRRGFDTLSRRATLTTAERLACVVRTWVHWVRTGDPVAAFEAASAVPSRPDRPRLAVGSFRPARRLTGVVLSILGVGSR